MHLYMHGVQALVLWTMVGLMLHNTSIMFGIIAAEVLLVPTENNVETSNRRLKYA